VHGTSRPAPRSKGAHNVPSFSTTLEQSIHGALALANARKHELATLEHLLLALIDEPDAARVMQACSVNLDDLRKDLEDFIEDDLSNLITDVDGSEAVPTAAFQRVIQRAAIHVQSSGRQEVTGANVLVAIFAERESNAAYFLQEQDMTRYDAVNFIAHGVAKDPAFGESRPVTGSPDGETVDAAEADEEKSALAKYCVDLNAKATKGDVDPLIGRAHEVERCIQVLCRRRKNNPLLVGDPGVGKTAIAEGLGGKLRCMGSTTYKEFRQHFAKIARIPPKNVSKDDAEVLKDLEKSLKRVVFGQDTAIEALSSAIKLARAGLREPEKPIGNYLFAGPTGVGKTEVAKQLADTLGVELLRFDMSEYMEKHAVSRLIGAPPGYVGFDQGGMLTDGVDQNPHCVLLLDEMEKAHPDVYNILLQVMDHGKLTDHNGRTTDFRNVILIMTSNAGAAELSKNALGFGRESREGEDTIAIEKHFTPRP